VIFAPLILFAFPFAVRSLETNDFASTGEVASTPGRFEWDGFHYAYGGGLRFALSKEEKLNLRVDYGVAKHSNAFTVQLRVAF
jgi:hypothetical protein